jgi:hypothetical protein
MEEELMNKRILVVGEGNSSEHAYRKLIEERNRQVHARQDLAVFALAKLAES